MTQGPIDIEAEAIALAKQVAEDCDDMLQKAAGEKQCGYNRGYVRNGGLAADLVPAVEAYLTECQSDASMWSDWDWAFMRDVITPALGDKVFGERRYAGFGPKSVTMRFKNSPLTPEFGKMMHDLYRRHREFSSK